MQITKLSDKQITDTIAYFESRWDDGPATPEPEGVVLDPRGVRHTFGRVWGDGEFVAL